MDLITPSSGLLFWMLLIFAIVFFVLAKWAFPAIGKALTKREAYIHDSLEEARQAKEQLASMQETCKQMLDETRRQQDKLLAEAKKTAGEIVENSKTDARNEARIILDNAKAEIEQQKQEAVNELSSVVATLAVALSEKVLRGELSNENRQVAMSEKLLEEIKQMKRN